MEFLPGGYLAIASKQAQWGVVHVTNTPSTEQEPSECVEHLLATFDSRSDAVLHACKQAIAHKLPFSEFSGYWINPAPGDDLYVFQGLSEGLEPAHSNSAVGMLITDDGKVIEILPLEQILETTPTPGQRLAICRDDVAWEHYCLVVPALAHRTEPTQDSVAVAPAPVVSTEVNDIRIAELERKLEEAIAQGKKNIQMIAAAWRGGRIGALTKTFGPLRVPVHGMTVEIQSPHQKPLELVIRCDGLPDKTLSLTQVEGEITLLVAHDGLAAYPVSLEREALQEPTPPAP